MWTEWPYALPGEDPEEMTFAVALSLLRVQERREGEVAGMLLTDNLIVSSHPCGQSSAEGFFELRRAEGGAGA